MQTVIVLTCTELGWDCVMGVYPATEENIDKLEQKQQEDKTLVLHYKTLEDFDLDHW